VLEGVLGGQHEERIGQRVRGLADGDLAFLHGLEQRALHLGRRTVDLVGEHEVREDRAVPHLERRVARIVDQCADHVGRQQVGRELQAVEREGERARQRPHGERLGHAGRPLEQHVPVHQQADQHAVHEPVLPDDDAAHLREQRLDEGAAFGDGRVGRLRGWGHRGAPVSPRARSRRCARA
jgi:hypothetical protein